MHRLAIRSAAALFVASVAFAGAARAQGASEERNPAAAARADRGIMPYSSADVEFMTGMIGHHAQAVTMAEWAESHGASRQLQRLTTRIVVAQNDEIAFLRRWLSERNLPVPDAHAHPHGNGHGDHGLMPGMLTEAEMAALDAARGTEFDRLFLTSMIKHHEGAVAMVQKLLDSHAAAQDEDVFKFAADVAADQTSEIDRMTEMLAALPPRAP